MWNMVRYNSKSNIIYKPPKQIKALARLWYNSWGNATRAGLIVSKAFVLWGHGEVFPCCSLSPYSLPLALSPTTLLEINGAGVISQQPALSPRTNQCDHEEGKSGIVFKESKFAVGELVRFALFSFFHQEHFGGSMPPLTFLARLWSKL